MPTEGGEVAEHGIFGKGGHEGAVGGEGPKGHSAAQGLRQADHVGGDARGHEGEGLAAAAEAGLDFVDDQQGPGRAAARLQIAEPCVVSRNVARFRLDCLDQYRSRVRPDGVEDLGSVKGEDPVPRNKRTVGRLHALVAHGRQGPSSRSVVGTLKGQDFGSPRSALGQFEGPIDRLGPGIPPINLVHGIRKGCQKGLRISNLRKLCVLAIDHQVHVLRSLMLHRGHDFGMAMTQVGNSDTRNKIHVGLALQVVEVNPFSPHKLERQRAEGCGGQGMQKALAKVHAAKVRGS